jgi:selenocysteine lyase/cysteine desulfurase
MNPGATEDRRELLSDQLKAIRTRFPVFDNKVVRRLSDEGIVASNGMDGLRVSFHLYNTLEDVRAVLRIPESSLDLTVPTSTDHRR